MTDTTEVENEIIQALQGDEEAIKILAQRLQGVPPAPDAPDSKAEWYRAAYKFRDGEDSELFEDPTTRAALVEYDAQLAQKFPQWAPDVRLKAAATLVRRHGTPEDLDRRAAVAAEMAHRGRAKNVNTYNIEALQDTVDAADAEATGDYADTIASLKKSRMPHTVEEEMQNRHSARTGARAIPGTDPQSAESPPMRIGRQPTP